MLRHTQTKVKLNGVKGIVHEMWSESKMAANVPKLYVFMAFSLQKVITQ